MTFVTKPFERRNQLIGVPQGEGKMFIWLRKASINNALNMPQLLFDALCSVFIT